MNFVFDLDGTICFDRRTISADIKEILENAPKFGHRVVFASARAYRDCIDVLGNQLAQNLVIGLNGGLAYEAGNLIFHQHLEKNAYALALSYCHNYQLPYFVDDDFNYASFYDQKIPFIKSVDPLNLAQKLAIDELYNPIKMVIYMGEREELVEELCHDLLATKQLDVDYHAHEKCLYLNPHMTNKATTIVKMLGKNFVAFGNDKNDIAMFEASAYSVQVGEFDLLQPYADEIISTVDLRQKILEVFERFS